MVKETSICSTLLIFAVLSCLLVNPSAGEVYPTPADPGDTVPGMAGSPGVITVGPSGCDYTRIKDAVTNASDGDTILVMSGTYPETFVIDRSVTISGNDTGTGMPVIGEANSSFIPVGIDAPFVTLENLTIVSTGDSAVKVRANHTTIRGITAKDQVPLDPDTPIIDVAENLADITVTDCVLGTEGGYGVLFTNDEAIVVTNNTVSVNSGAEKAIEAISALYTVDNATFSGITVVDNIVQGGPIEVGVTYKFENQPRPVLKNILVHNNTLTDVKPVGILIFGYPHITRDQEYLYDRLNVTVTDNTVSGWEISYGIHVSWAQGGTIAGNTVENGFGGMAGLRLGQSDGFEVTGNTVRNCVGGRQVVGLDIAEVKNSVVTGNILSENQMNFAYTPGGESTPNMTIAATNLADGRPIYYYESVSGLTVDESMDPSALYLVNCDDVMVEGIAPSTNDAGIVVYNSRDVQVKDCTVHHTYNGIILSRSEGCDIHDNTIDDALDGFLVYDSADSTFTQNLVNDTEVAVQLLLKSENLAVTENTLRNTNAGIFAAYVVDGSSITLNANTLEGGLEGIVLKASDHLSVRDNLIRNFTQAAIYGQICKSGLFENNTVENLKYEDEDGTFAVIFINIEELDGKSIYRGGNHTFCNNRVTSPSHVYIGNMTPGEPVNLTGVRWTDSLQVPEYSEEEDVDPSAWNCTKTEGKNIIGGPYLGGNYWAKPDGTGWSQVHPDRGDGFCNASYVFDDLNADYLPLHTYLGPDPVAGFNATPCTGYAPLTVQFQDASAGNVTAWYWSFGDGQSSDLQNPAHVYGAAGTYTVTLNDTGPTGQSEVTRAGYITVNNPGSGGGGGRSTSKATTGTGALTANSQGLVLRDTRVAAGDSVGNLGVPIGATALAGNGAPLSEGASAPSGEPSHGSTGTYSFAGYAYACGPAGATFSPAADLVFTFTEEEWNALTAGGRPRVVMYYNETTGAYEEVPTSVNAATRTVTASVTHFSSFVLMHAAAAEAETPVPATGTPTTATAIPTATTPAAASPAPEPDLPLLIIGGVIVVLVIAAGAFFFMRK